MMDRLRTGRGRYVKWMVNAQNTNGRQGGEGGRKLNLENPGEKKSGSTEKNFFWRGRRRGFTQTHTQAV